MPADDRITEMAVYLVRHRGWLPFVNDMSESYFSRWLNAETLDDRESIHLEYKAFRKIVGKLRMLGDQEKK